MNIAAKLALNEVQVDYLLGLVEADLDFIDEDSWDSPEQMAGAIALREQLRHAKREA